MDTSTRGRGKKYRKVVQSVDRLKMYDLEEAVSLVKESSFVKFDETVDLAISLGLDPRQADQNIRGAVVLPHGLGKEVRIIVFAKGEKAVEAEALGVQAVGLDDLAEKIQGGWFEFDQVVATPDVMATVGKLGKLLGPRGLMPNPKLGTVTFDVAKAVNELKAGRAEYKLDKAAIVHTPVGKVSFTADKLKENAASVVEALVKAKPSTSKGIFLKKISVSSTMGPGIFVNPAPFRN